jgi:2'-5' RNA ligase
MPRAFLAISLPLALRSTLGTCREVFLSADPSWRGEKWVADENLHVTLRFLGNVPEAVCPLVAEAVAASLADSEPYRLRLDIVRAIPRPRSASLLWVAPRPSGDPTLDLAARVEAATRFLEYEPDGRTFKTHVTLCRARHPRRAAGEALDAVEHILTRSDDRAVSMSVREVTLFSSVLTPRGPVYEELAVVPLGG